MYSGFPARPHRENLRREASVEAIAGLKARLARLEAQFAAEVPGSADRH
jgi:UDP-3-O-[3-hydroxymyristoyl] glucosamine N-acyltransferase